MLNKMRREVIEHLWSNYCKSTEQVKLIEYKLQTKHIAPPTLDHLAIIDLPGPHTGINELQKIFQAIGYAFNGKDYLPEKQNDFTWMSESTSNNTQAELVLPQVVLADFRLDELPLSVRNIICKFSYQAPASPAAMIVDLVEQVALNKQGAYEQAYRLIANYLNGRDWALPTIKEFTEVHEFNELLAWVLVFGRRANHFTYAIHLMPAFASLSQFHEFITNDVGLPLNHIGGTIKGNKTIGIEQGSTVGSQESIALADGTVQLPTGFVEFAWRYPTTTDPILWNDYFTGFVANHANRVIQSLYKPTISDLNATKQ